MSKVVFTLATLLPVGLVTLFHVERLSVWNLRALKRMRVDGRSFAGARLCGDSMLTCSCKHFCLLQTLYAGAVLLSSNSVAGDACPQEVELSDSDLKSGSSDGTEVIIKLSDTDLNKLKKLEGLAISQTTSFLSVTANAIDDMAGEKLAQIDHKPANKFVADGVKCNLVSFDLSMNAGTLSLTFDETVNAPLFDGTQLTLLKAGNLGNGAVQGAGALTLKAGSSTQTDSTIITFTLDPTDLNKLKLDTSLATGDSNTYLAATADSVSDQNGQSMVAITADQAKQVRTGGFTADTTKPELASFELNMNTATMILTFSEAVDASTLQLTKLALGNKEANPTKVVQLVANGATASTANGLEITISAIAKDQMNAIKAATDLATSQANTVLLIQADGVRDMNDQIIALAVKTVKATPTPDSVHPTLTKFDFSLDEGGSARLEFDESIDVGSLSAVAITLQSAKTSDGIKEHTLSVNAEKDANDVNGPVINVRFPLADGDAIKQLEFCTETSNCFVRITSSAIADMVGKAVTAVADGSAIQASSVTKDTTKPEIESVSELTREGKITIVFSEPIAPEGLDYTGLTLYGSDPDKFTNEASTTLELTDGSTTSTTGRTLVIQMVDDDVDKLKAKSNLCSVTNGATCYLKFSTKFAKDIFDNALVAKTGFASSVVLDTTAPKIASFSVDLKTNFLKLTFDEPVQVSGFSPSSVTFQASGTDATAASRTLAQNDQSLKDEADSRVVNVPLQVADQVAIKALTDLGTEIADSFISMAAGTVKDLSNIDNAELAKTAAKQATAYDADNTDPVFLLFGSANPNTGTIRLQFNEPVDKTSLDATKLRLQQDASGSGTPITLTTPAADSVSYPDDTTKMIIDIELTSGDKEKLGKDTNLFTSRSDTYILVSTGAIKDMAGRSVQTSASAAKVDTFLERDPAALSAYTVDMKKGEIVLTFSAVVKVDPFTPEKVTLQAAAIKSNAGAHYLTLDDSVMSGGAGSEVTIKLGTSDLNKLKADRGLFTKADRSDSFIAFDGDALLDNFDDAITAVPDTSAAKADTFIADDVSPEITSYDLSLDPGKVTITYSEQVDVNTFNAAGLSFQSAVNDNTVKVDLSGGSVAETDTATVITYTLSDTNLDDLKFKALATTTTNTWLAVATNHIDDMAGVDVKEIPSSAAKQANAVSVDSTAPTLSNFVLDMTAETLTMTFSEAVLVASLKQNKFTIRDGAPGTSGVTLSGPSSSNSQLSPTVVQISLSLTDLNALKANTAVALDKGSTFLACAADAIQDASTFSIEAIANGNAKPANAYEKDNTDPKLTSVALNINAKTLTLGFDETVNVNAFKAQTVLFAKTSQASASTPGDGKYLLTTSSSVQTVNKNSDSVVIDISVTDLNAIKRDATLAVSEGSTFISFPSTAVSDVEGNPVETVNPEAARKVTAGQLTADATGPILQSFTLDLQNEVLTILFDEPVDSSLLAGNKLTLSASPSSNSVPDPAKHPLEGGQPAGSSDGLTVTLSLTTNDLNAIKKLETVGTAEGNTWLSMAAGAATDVAARTSLELSLANAKKADQHSPDLKAPTANAFSMNMVAETFKVGFTETIDISSIVYTKFTFQIASSVTSGADKHTLTGGSLVSTEDGTEVEVTISANDMNTLKEKSIANLQSRAHLVIEAGAIFDMNNRPVNAVADGSALNANPHVKDNANPSIDKVVSLSMHLGILKLSFDESILATSLQADKLYIQNNDKTVYNCPCQKCLDSEYKNADCTATVDTDCRSCLLCNIGEYETDACTDTSNSQCATCTPCSTGTFLSTLCFGVTDTDCKDCPTNCKACSGDVNFCTECEAGYSLMSAGVHAGKCFKDDLSDMVGPYIGNQLPSVYADGNGKFQSCHAKCKTCTGRAMADCTECAPPYTKVGDKCSDTCEDTADSVNGGHQGITTNGVCEKCHSSCDACTAGIDAMACASCNGDDYLRYHFTDTNSDGLGDRSCVAKNNAGVTCPAKYMDGSLQRGSVTANECIPCSAHCDECSANVGCITCSAGAFREVVSDVAICSEKTPLSETERLNALPVSPQKAYPVGASSRGDQTCVLQDDVTTHTVDVSSSTSSSNGAQIDIQLSNADLNALKFDTGISTSTSNTFIAFDAELFTDMAQNPVNEKSKTPVCPEPCFGTCECPIDSIVANVVDSDGIKPSLVSFDLSMDGNGLLTMVFSETIHRDSFDPKRIQLQIGDGDTSATQVIEGQSTKWTSYTTVEIVPTTDELNELKGKRTLAIDEASTWMSLEDLAAKDMNNNKINPVLFNSAKQVRTNGYTADATEPELVSFDFNADTKVLQLVFSETVDASTVTSTAIRFQDDATASDFHPLSGEKSKSTIDGTKISITLTDDDMNAIKAKYGTPMAASETNTFLQITAAVVKDCAKVPNSAKALGAGSGKQVRTGGGYVPDGTDPEIDEYELNMNSNKLTILFTETVKLSVLDETKMTFTAPSATPYTLTDSATWAATPPAKAVVLTLSTVDMNALKQNLGLCNDDGTTNLVITTAAVTDMAGNSVKKIDSPGLNVKLYTIDSTRPELTHFDLDMMKSKLTLTFSETVDVANLDETQITLQQKVTASQGTKYTLTSDSVAAGSGNVNSHIAIITIGAFDMNSIKATENLAIDGEKIFITMAADAVEDMASSPSGSKVVNDGFGVEVTNFVPDTNLPTLTAFDLNMDTTQAKLSMTFSETVRASSLKSTAFTLVSSRTLVTGNNKFTLTLPAAASSSALNVLNFDLTASDMNQIKVRTALATSDADVYIWTEDYGNGNAQAVQDMEGNNLVPITAAAALRITTGAFVADDTAPELVSFSAQMVSGAPPVLLKLVFSEPVKVVNTMDVSGFVLQPDAAGSDSNAAVALTSATSSRAADLVTVDITVSATDLASIRAKENVGRSASVTFASILAKFTTDEANNPIKVIGADKALAVDASPFTVDIVPPTLEKFDLDFSNQKLTLSFSEAVVLSTLDISKLSLQGSKTSNAHTVTVDGQPASDNNDFDVVITLPQAKVNEIKALSNLAVSDVTTFIVVDTGAIEDGAENDCIAITTADAKQVNTYTKDNIPPTLTSYDFNMKTGVFTLLFSEVMDITEFDLSKMILQNKASSATAETPALAGAVFDATNAVDSTKVILELTEASANEARKLANAATSAADTFIRFTAGFAKDVDGVAITEKNANNAKGCNANGYVSDNEPPTPTNFEIDFTSDDMITLHFTQPVDSDTVDPKTITMQYDPNTLAGIRTLTGGTASGGFTTAVKISLIEADINEIKRLDLCSADGNGENCFIRYGADFGDDSEGNAIAALNAGVSVSPKANGYTKDNTRPEIAKEGFTKFDLNTGIMTISFSETVDRNNFDATKLTLRNAFQDASHVKAIKLEATTMVSTADGTSLQVKITNDDLNKLKADRSICITDTSCYLKADSGAVLDMAGNPSTATDASDFNWSPFSYAQTLIADATGPVLESFDLNMNTQKLVLHFDETIEILEFDAKGITLQGGVDESFKHYTLTGGEAAQSSSPSSDITITLLSADVNEIKLLKICRTAAETFLAATAETISDMVSRDANSNPNKMQVVPRSNAKPTNANAYQADETKPLLLAYTLNLDSGQLILSFNEPVDTTKTTATKFTLQSDATANPTFSRDLAVAEMSEAPSTATLKVTFTLAENDISAIKLDTDIGTSVSNTYLAFEAGATADTKGLEIVALAGETAQEAAVHITDTSFGALQSFDLNLEERLLTMSFDEIMDPTTLVASAITIRAAKNTDEQPKYSLSTSKARDGAAKDVLIDLSNADVLGLSLIDGLATAQSDTFLTMTVSALRDAFSREVIGVSTSNAHQVTNFEADSGPPEINDSVLDMAKGTLGITFTEAVNKLGFDPTKIKLQHVQDLDSLGNGAPPQISISTTAASATWADDYESVVIKLNDEDLDAIRVRTDLGTSNSNTYFVFGGDLVSDFAPTPNKIVAATSGNAVKVIKHEADDVKPKLTSFGVNMDTGKLSLHFDETMQAKKIDMGKFTFQGVEDLTATD